MCQARFCRTFYAKRAQSTPRRSTRGSVVETRDRDLGFESLGVIPWTHGGHRHDGLCETVAGLTCPLPTSYGRHCVTLVCRVLATRFIRLRYPSRNSGLRNERGGRRRKGRGREIRWIRVTSSSQQPVIPGAAQAHRSRSPSRPYPPRSFALPTPFSQLSETVPRERGISSRPFFGARTTLRYDAMERRECARISSRLIAFNRARARARKKIPRVSGSFGVVGGDKSRERVVLRVVTRAESRVSSPSSLAARILLVSLLADRISAVMSLRRMCVPHARETIS